MKGVLCALPPYFGSKRRLLGRIFAVVPSADDAGVFADAFLGGGSVALVAKARGYRVVANDVADRSVIIGRALVENGRVELTYDDLVRVCVHQDVRTFSADVQAPDIFPSAHARLLDTILANSSSLTGTKAWLARLLAVKYALRLRPMGNFGAKKIMQQAAEGAWEEMNYHYVRDLAKRGATKSPLRLADEIRREINAGVFANGHENRVQQGDAVEFLSSVNADIAYLDPPYPGTQSYERSLRPLDEMLTGCKLDVTPSRFSGTDAKGMIDELFEAAAHIETVVLSYGNAVLDIGELMDIVRRHRPKVEGQALRYTHLAGLANAESKAANRELLIVARRT